MPTFLLRQPAAGRIDRVDELEEVFHPDVRAAGEDVFRGPTTRRP